MTVLTGLVGSLGGEPTPEPEVDFGNAFSSQTSYLELAQVFEDTGVSAYNGAGPELESKEALATAGTIVQIEGRHAALIRMMRGGAAGAEGVRRCAVDSAGADEGLAVPGGLRVGLPVLSGRRLDCRGHRGVAQPGSAHRSGR